MWTVHLFCVALIWCLRTFPVLLTDFSFGAGADMELDSMRLPSLQQPPPCKLVPAPPDSHCLQATQQSLSSDARKAGISVKSAPPQWQSCVV